MSSKIAIVIILQNGWMCRPFKCNFLQKVICYTLGSWNVYGQGTIAVFLWKLIVSFIGFADNFIVNSNLYNHKKYINITFSFQIYESLSARNLHEIEEERKHFGRLLWVFGQNESPSPTTFNQRKRKGFLDLPFFSFLEDFQWRVMLSQGYLFFWGG